MKALTAISDKNECLRGLGTKGQTKWDSFHRDEQLYTQDEDGWMAKSVVIGWGQEALEHERESYSNEQLCVEVCLAKRW